MRASLRGYLRNQQQIELIDINLIKPSAISLRKELGDLTELMESIRQNGLIQPIVVRIRGSHFEVIVGNRRLAACKRLRWATTPCIVKEMDDKDAFELSIIENIQRKSLNVIEEAEAFKRYVEEFGWGSITQLARRIGKSPEYVSHRIKLLDLPKPILELIERQEVPPSTAQELVWLEDKEKLEKMGKGILEMKVSAKKVRAMVKLIKKGESLEQAMRQLDIPDFCVEKSRSLPQIKVLEDAILVLRICLVRLDSVIERASQEHIKRLLIEKRYVVHQLVDELIRLKRSIAASMS